MNSGALVTIIIPVYNVEKYLDTCLESAVSQSYEKLEIILVDDGSKDSSGKLCDEWAEKDTRIKVLHKKNEGLNFARRDGFRESTGEYITFLDSDDALHKDAVKISLNNLQRSKSDVAVFGYKEFSDKDKVPDMNGELGRVLHETRLLATKEEIMKYALLGNESYSNSHSMTVWGKMYKRQVVEDVDWRVSNFRSYEDNFWTPQALSVADKVTLLSSPLYYYRRNEDYGTKGKTLGSRLVGNSVNGNAVGYVELIDKLYIFYKKIAEKSKIDLDVNLKDLRYQLMWWRTGNLVEAELLGEENNLKYLKEIWVEHRRRDEGQNELVTQLAHQNSAYELEVERLSKELSEYLKIKPTAKRLVGNIKRYVRHRLGFPFRLVRGVVRRVKRLLPYPALLFLQKVRNKLTTKVIYVENKKADPKLPLVSIVTPFYNSSATIGETVQSVLNQTLQDFEYVIINDGSDPEHAKVLDTIKHPKIKVVHLEGNIGNGSPAAARNHGIKMTKGKYVVCLDADDTIEPTYLEKCVTVLETHPNLGLVSTNTRAFGEINEDWDYTDYNPLELIKNNMITTAAMYRRSVWEEVGGYKEGIGYEDWELWINMAEHGHYAFRLKDRLFNYRTAQSSRFIDDRKKHEENVATIYGLHPSYKSLVRKAYRKSRRRAYRVVPQSALGSISSPEQYKKDKNTKPNVLVAMPWMTFGGAETLIVNFCNEVKDSFNLSFITGLPSSHEWEDKFKSITPNIYHLANLFEDRKLYLEFVSNYVETRNIDILHIVHTNFVAEFIEELKVRHPKLKVIITVFNDRAHLKESIDSSDYVDEYTSDNHAVQKRYLHELSKKGADKPIRVIPNGINSIDVFNPNIHDRAAQRKELGVEEDELAVFFVGRLSEEKNPDVFVESARKVLGEGHEKIKFFIIGDGPMRQKLEQQIKRSYKSENIVYLGYQSDIARYLSAADVFVLPSSIEGFPLSILEAMAMKTAVIASDVGAVSDVIESSVDGFVIKPGSSEEIKDKIILLNSNRELLKRMQQKSRKKVEQKYSNEILRKNYKQLYKDLLK